MPFCLAYKLQTFIDYACLSPLFCAFAQVLQMYLPFCGISISNAKLFLESRKEYERSRVRKCKLCIYKNMFDCFIATRELTVTLQFLYLLKQYKTAFEFHCRHIDILDIFSSYSLFSRFYKHVTTKGISHNGFIL